MKNRSNNKFKIMVLPLTILAIAILGFLYAILRFTGKI